MKKLSTAACALALGLAIAGCSSSNSTPRAASAASVNSTCPISGHAVDGVTTVSYKGKTVGFCCQDCVGKWNSMADAQKQSKLTTATAGHPN